MNAKLAKVQNHGLAVVRTVTGVCAALVIGAGEAADVIDIVQKNREFSASDITIPRESSLHFINADKFPHQVHVAGAGMEVDSPLQSPGATLNVVFSNKGTFEVTCGIHPRMHMIVTIN